MVTAHRLQMTSGTASAILAPTPTSHEFNIVFVERQKETIEFVWVINNNKALKSWFICDIY